MASSVPKHCKFCDKLFDAPLGEVKRGKAIFCSFACFRLSISTINIIKKCDHCSKEFNIIHQGRKNARFCCRECYYIGSKNETLEKRKALDKRCNYCNNPIPFAKDYAKRHYCCIGCASKHGHIERLYKRKEKKEAQLKENEYLRKEIHRLKALLNDN